MEKREFFYTVGENANKYSHYGEQCGDSLKKREIELPYDLAIPLLGTQTRLLDSVGKGKSGMK